MISESSPFSENEVCTLALKYFGLSGTIKALAGEVDYNYYLKTEENAEYTIKISRDTFELETISFQNTLQQFLAHSEIPFTIPKPFQAKNGANKVEFIGKTNKKHLIRVQRWVPGRMIGTANPRSPELLLGWGKACGLLAKHLQGFDHPAAHSFYKWNPSETLHARAQAQYFQKKEEQEIANYFWDYFEKNTNPKLADLRKSVNHNDCHDLNVVISEPALNPQVTGIIDFGDALYCETINELAIACAYGCMYLADPLEAAVHMVRGYHAAFPLLENELEVLYSMIAARLLITVANAAENKHLEPDNEYLVISEKPAWELLKKWHQINPKFAEYRFRAACGFAACPKEKLFKKWATSSKHSLSALVDFSDKKVVPFDLSVGSLELGNNTNFDTISGFERHIQRTFEEKEGQIGVGGYLETRPIYTTDAYEIRGNSGPQWRTVHLGSDIWMEAGSPIYAPLAGRIHSFQDNDSERDYGPTIIVEHTEEIEGKELVFYTLYGHLSRTSLDGLFIGKKIAAGEQIAEIGPAPENGNWPPHLHFQVMLDMLGKEGDFPGVAFPSELATWQSICPDPAPFLSGHPSSFSKKQKSQSTILQSREKSLGKSLSISYQKPLHIVRGYKQYLYASDGRRYLDTVNNVAHVGHEHPKVVRAAQRQMGLLNTNTRYLHENIIEFSEKLLATFPPELNTVYFVNSGSEANELAIRMAKTWSNQKDMLAVEVGYHGNTGACVDVSSYKFNGKGGKGAPLHTHIVPIPDVFRGKYKDPKTAGKQYTGHIEKAIKQVQSMGRNIAGFICESILSCGGQIVLPEGYLSYAYKAVRAAGGLCVADEVQVGFGRVGNHFWGFELQGVVPDIVTMGKPIGNGHPLAAVVTTQAVADAFTNGMEYFNTFGGNPVSCAVGSAVLDVIHEEKLQNRAFSIGMSLKKGLFDLKAKFPIIGDVRGHGLFLGFELIKNRKTLAPATEQASYLSNRMRDLGILTSTDGPFSNVIKIKPPMCITEENIDFFLESLERVLGEDYML